MQVNNFPQLFEWCYQHMALVGYPALAIAAWRMSKWVAGATTTAQTAVDQINKMSTEHFPAMKKSLENQDELLRSVDGSLKTMVSGQVQFSAAKPVRRKRRK